MVELKAFENPNGRLVPADGHYAFVPNPLPRTVEYTASLVMALSDADQALAELRGLGRAMSNPYILIPLFKRREAVLSSKIEGTQTTFMDLAVYEAGQRLLSFDRAAVPGDAPEVFNSVSLRLIRELHGILLQGVRGGYAHPGHFRDGLVWIGPAGSPIQASQYVPPPRDALLGLLDDFEIRARSRPRAFTDLACHVAVPVRGHPPVSRREWPSGPVASLASLGGSGSHATAAPIPQRVF